MKARLLVVLAAIASMVLSGGAWKTIAPDG